MFLSVIISTFNPSVSRFSQTLNSLKDQTIAPEFWELIIIDNNSTNNFTNELDLNWHPQISIFREPTQGLTHARVKGFTEANYSIIIMVDDDNVLSSDYLSNTLNIFKDHQSVGAIGGRSIPLFEVTPPEWIINFYSSLALRDLGENVFIDSWDNKYPVSAPIGAGMAIRKEALYSYVKKVTSGENLITDRKGSSLSSGGDNDIVLEILRSGWDVGYFPSLTLKHIISYDRVRANYLARLINNTNKSWVQLLEGHGINPWAKIAKWTVPLRKIKAWFSYRAWKSPVNYINWKGACGTFEGLGDI